MMPLIVANWKMNPGSLAEAKKLFKAVKNTRAIICPPFIYLSSLKASGSQDVFWKEGGAFTGEISALMLKNTGVKYVIVGHSERRKYLKETDSMVYKKIKAVLKQGLKPILCVDKLSQIKKGLKNTIIVYEPLFAVGTGKSCSPEMAKKMNLAIKKKIGKNTLVLYGGSVNSSNVREYIKAGFDGVLVGRASLDPKEFIDIIKMVCYGR